MKTILLSDIIKNQAILNVGCVGHVSNGKSTLVKQMTGIKTQKFKSEKERNCTINIGYGNCKIYYSKKTDEYKFTGSGVERELDSQNNEMMLIHHISFVDCPGHENYMSNMLCGTSVIDMAFLVEAANAEIVPQPQTLEHCMAVQQAGIDDIVVIQNKCDLVSKEKLLINKRQIDDFIEDYTDKEDIYTIPLVAQTGQNINYVGEYLATKLNNYNKDINLPLMINIIRTFDVNSVNCKSNKLIGGVLGGSIVQGILFKDDIIQISPGICKKTDNGWNVQPIFSYSKSLCSEKNKADYAIAGGLIGIGTMIDPAYTKNNNLVGHIITHPGENPDIVTEITIKYKSFRKVSKEDKQISKGEIVKLGILCKQVTGMVKKWSKKEKQLTVVLSAPCCINNKPISIMKKIRGIYKIFSIGHYLKDKCKFVDIEVPDEMVNIKKDKYKLINDIDICSQFKEHSYYEMKDKLICQKSVNTSLNLPNPYFSRAKNGNLQILHNYNEILYKINNNNDTVSIKQLIEQEIENDLACSVSSNEKKALLVHGKVKVNVIQNTLVKLINKYRCCPVCKSFKTYLHKYNRLVVINCEECKSENTIT